MSTFPLSVRNPREVRLSSLSPTILSRAHSGRTLVQSAGAQRWQIEASWPPLTRDQAHELLAYLVTLRGRYETFDFVPPNTSTPRGAGESAVSDEDIQVYADRAAGLGTLWTKGWDTSMANVMRKGDLIRFAGHTKTYMVNQDLNSNSSGLCLTYLAPQLLSPIATDEVVSIADVPITCRLTSDLSSVTTDYAMRYGLSIQMEESW